MDDLSGVAATMTTVALGRRARRLDREAAGGINSGAAQGSAPARPNLRSNAGWLLARLASPLQVIPAETGRPDWDSPLAATYP
jgi:hypothetical protein